jgi:hypothetical protein
MKALIVPEQNNRIAQVEINSFDVAPPWYWVDCPDEVTSRWTYVNEEFIAPAVHIPTADENKATAMTILIQTDWTSITDIGNPQVSNPYLANQAEFIAYRNAIRNIAVYPVAGNINWPTLPSEEWQII